MKKENGLTLIALVIIIVAIGIVVYVGIQYAREYMDNQKNEDIKAEMLAIQGAITNIQNMHTVDEEENLLVGTNLILDNNTTEYKISEEFNKALLAQENANLYILNTEDLKNNGLDNISVDKEKFYVVDYNSCEIFYSLGIDGKYKLSDM